MTDLLEQTRNNILLRSLRSAESELNFALNTATDLFSEYDAVTAGLHNARAKTRLALDIVENRVQVKINKEAL